MMLDIIAGVLTAIAVGGVVWVWRMEAKSKDDYKG